MPLPLSLLGPLGAFTLPRESFEAAMRGAPLAGLFVFCSRAATGDLANGKRSPAFWINADVKESIRKFYIIDPNK